MLVSLILASNGFVWFKTTHMLMSPCWCIHWDSTITTSLGIWGEDLFILYRII